MAPRLRSTTIKSTTTAKKSQESPGDNSYAITPSDGVEIGEFLPRALYVGVGGDISLQLEGDDADTVFVAVPSGSFLPLKVRIVNATGTTASSLVAIY